MFKSLLTVLVLLMLVSGGLFAQTVMLEPYGVSPAQIKADTLGNEGYLGILDRIYTGLLNVGVESKMVLKGSVDTTLMSPGWTITQAPDGSVAALMDFTDADSATQLATFTPDIVGTYMIEFAANGGMASVTINAGTYLGVGDEAGCTNGFCHSGQVTQWAGTDHASFFTRALDGEVSSHYSESCVSCHVTGFDTLANNGGFDDWDFVFPTELVPGMADSMKATYPDAMHRANIQCESCHGPASEHNGATDNSKMVVSFDAAVCASCHDDDHYHVYPSQLKYAGHSNIPPYPGGSRTDCRGCHNGAQFVQFANGEEISKVTDRVDITCAVCHDPHNSFGDTPEADNGRFQIRTIDAVLSNGEMVTEGGNGKLCMNCHQSRRDALTYTNGPRGHYGPHYAPQADMLIGTNAVTFGKKLPTSAHLAATENACVDCHMYEKGSHGEHDEDGNLNTAGMHSFSMVSQEGVDNVSACVDCHGNFGSEFGDKKYFMNGRGDHDGDGTVEGLQDEIHGMMDNLGAMLPDDDPHADVDETWTVTELKAAFNHRMVYYDHSYGIHNPAFTVALLKVTMQALMNNAIEGEIVAIDDVPNDYGKQVTIIWDKFVDDGIANDPIASYSVKRMDGDSTVWTSVGEVTADGSKRYALIVPTLYDSTGAEDGMTYFKVSAISQGGMVHVSEAGAGYSIKDLMPQAPENPKVLAMDGDAAVSWDAPMPRDEKDQIKYYRVFRSTVEGFEPSDDNEIGTTADLEFTDANLETNTYYYKIAGVDFSGNTGDFSMEVSVSITGLEDQGKVPLAFNLSQNYPNPFNPVTRIDFSIKNAGHATLTVFNTLGQEVATLVDKDLAPGVYSTNFEANGMSSGVYFYRIQVTGDAGLEFQSMQKMILMK